MDVITAATVEPVTLAEAKMHLKIIADPADVSAHPEDAMVREMITAARQQAEEFINRAVAQATYEARGCGFDVVLLPPVGAILSVKYVDTAGTLQTLPNTVYELNGNRAEPRLRLKVGQRWPAVYAHDDAVRVQFTAGLAPASVPALIKAAIKVTLADRYYNRGGVVVGAVVSTLPEGARYLLQPYRVGMGV
jgi:uncharacterized phiE125 gp8 family phage protein